MHESELSKEQIYSHANGNAISIELLWRLLLKYYLISYQIGICSDVFKNKRRPDIERR